MPKGKPLQPPQAKEIPFTQSAHGVEWTDDYRWLQEKDDPEVIQHLKTENAFTDAYMSQFGDLGESLYHELIGRIEEDNVSAPYIDGDFVYQSRIDKGSDYRKYYRRKKNTSGEWILYFNAQEESRGNEYFDLAFLDVSPNGQLLAYAVDHDGSEQYCLKFRNLITNQDLQDEIPGVSGEGEWDASSGIYYFIREDDTRRPFQVYRHHLGNSPKQAKLVYEDSDPQFYVGISKSQDMQYLFASSSSKETTEISYLGCSDSQGLFTKLFPRKEGIQYGVEHQKGSWLIRTNENALDFKLLSCPVTNPALSEAKTIIPARNGIRLEDVIPFMGHLAITERTNGLDHICIKNLDTGESHYIETADPVYDLHPGANAEYNTSSFTFVYSSPIRPQQTILYEMDSRERKIIHSVQVPSGHCPDKYSVCRINVESNGGVYVPVTIFHEKEFPMDGTRPVYLYGYGAYGSPVGPHFRSTWLTFLERGFAIAIAHVRGSGMLGEQWYQSGKLKQKKNSFVDFIAVAEELIAKQYTCPNLLVIEGGSAGGLLIGAVLNLRPELFKAAVADVPFVDVLNTMMDDSLPLTTFEYEEWGNPNNPKFFEYIRSYAPCENIRSTNYPVILATAGYNDPRVPYWEPAKWVTLLRRHSSSLNPVLLKTYFDSGHAGASGRYRYLKEIAFTQAFLISQVKESPNEED